MSCHTIIYVANARRRCGIIDLALKYRYATSYHITSHVSIEVDRKADRRTDKDAHHIASHTSHTRTDLADEHREVRGLAGEVSLEAPAGLTGTRKVAAIAAGLGRSSVKNCV